MPNPVDVPGPGSERVDINFSTAGSSGDGLRAYYGEGGQLGLPSGAMRGISKHAS